MEYICGINAVTEALKSNMRTVETLLAAREKESSGRIRELTTSARKHGIAVKYVPFQILNKILPGRNHQGIAAQLSTVNYEPWENALKQEKGITIYIDRVTDCGNLGAILRSAAAFSVRHVLLAVKETAPINETVVSSSAGGTEHLRFSRIESPLKMLREFKNSGFFTIAAEAGGTELSSLDLKHDKILLILGGEDKGVRESLKKEADVIAGISLPGQISSLNVSVAAGIMLFSISSRS